MLRRQVFQVASIYPIEALYLEMGCVPIGLVIKARRLKYLHHIATKICHWLHPDLWHCYRHIVEVTIDEDRIYTLSRYLKRKAGKRVIPSDHNILFSKFNIEFERKSKKLRKEFFQFKCESGRKCFLEETNVSNKLSSFFLIDDNFEKSSNLFFKILNGTFLKCFQKFELDQEIIKVW